MPVKKENKKTTSKKTLSKDSPFQKFIKQKTKFEFPEDKPIKRKSSKSEKDYSYPDRKSSKKDNSIFISKDEKPTFKKSIFDKTRSEFPVGKKIADRKSNRDRNNKEDFEKSSGKRKLFNEDYFINIGKDESNIFDKKKKFSKEKEGRSTSSKKSNYQETNEDSIIRLNKFVAQSGLCSRRKAAELIKEGEIYVNGVKEMNPAYQMKDQDVVTHKGKVLKKEEKLLYVLMNKPKNVITTSEDEKGRKTVLDIIANRYEQRLYPVGRLDRNTTGLLLLTNDGDLAKKLSHPSHLVKKIYQVELNKNLSLKDLNKIRAGLELEDGIAEVDAIDYVDGGKKNQVGIEIHIGKNRIVRRIFETLGYEVIKLDRTYYGGLTKKDLPRGFTRELNEREIIMLKHFTNQRKKD